MSHQAMLLAPPSKGGLAILWTISFIGLLLYCFLVFFWPERITKNTRNIERWFTRKKSEPKQTWKDCDEVYVSETRCMCPWIFLCCYKRDFYDILNFYWDVCVDGDTDDWMCSFAVGEAKECLAWEQLWCFCECIFGGSSSWCFWRKINISWQGVTNFNSAIYLINTMT